MSLDKGVRLDLTTDQVKELVKQLPKKERIRMMSEVAREALGAELLALIKSIKADDIDQKTIDKEVEFVRAKRYAAWKRKAAKGHH
jgi:hypothetical protein